MPAKKTSKVVTKKPALPKEPASKRDTTTPSKKVAKRKTATKKKVAAKKTTETSRKATKPRAASQVTSIDEGTAPKEMTREGDGWLSEVSSGVQEKALKLLNLVPPEVRSNLLAHARQNGPRAALVAIDAAAGKVRGMRAKLALRALGGLLRMFVSTNPKQ